MPGKGNVDGKAYALADVQMVVGSKWKQRFLVKNSATVSMLGLIR